MVIQQLGELEPVVLVDLAQVALVAEELGAEAAVKSRVVAGGEVSYPSLVIVHGLLNVQVHEVTDGRLVPEPGNK